MRWLRRGLDAAALRSMSPRVRALLELVPELMEDERSELRAKLGGDDLDETEWTATWNDELSHRMAQTERGEWSSSPARSSGPTTE